MSWCGHFEHNPGFLHWLLKVAASHNETQKAFLRYCLDRCLIAGLEPAGKALMMTMPSQVPAGDLTLWVCFHDPLKQRLEAVKARWVIEASWLSSRQRGPGRRQSSKGILWFDSWNDMVEYHNKMEQYMPEPALPLTPCTTVAITLKHNIAMEMYLAGNLSRAYQEGWWWESADGVFTLPNAGGKRELYFNAAMSVEPTDESVMGMGRASASSRERPQPPSPPLSQFLNLMDL